MRAQLGAPLHQAGAWPRTIAACRRSGSMVRHGRIAGIDRQQVADERQRSRGPPPRRRPAPRSSFSTITDSGSASSMRHTRRIMSMTGWNGIARPNDSAWPSTQVALRPSCRLELVQQPRLADARLADDHHHLALARLRQLEALAQEPQLAVAPDEARAAGLGVAARRGTRRSCGRARQRSQVEAPGQEAAGGGGGHDGCRAARASSSACSARCASWLALGVDLDDVAVADDGQRSRCAAPPRAGRHVRPRRAGHARPASARRGPRRRRAGARPRPARGRTPRAARSAPRSSMRPPKLRTLSAVSSRRRLVSQPLAGAAATQLACRSVTRRVSAHGARSRCCRLERGGRAPVDGGRPPRRRSAALRCQAQALHAVAKRVARQRPAAPPRA